MLRDRSIGTGHSPSGVARPVQVPRSWGTAVVLFTLAVVALDRTTGLFVRIQADPAPGDFAVFWVAARLALGGAPGTVFDTQAFIAALGQVIDMSDAYLFWLYAPAYHLLVMPLGLLPLRTAYAVFLLVSLAAFAAAMRPVVRPFDRGLLLALVSPPVALVVMFGQNALLSAAAMIGALETMRRGRPALAGLCLALLTLKPQLGVLIPIALIADRRWAVILWTVALSVVIHVGAAFAFGWSYVEAMLESPLLDTGACGPTDRCIASLVTPVATLRSLGVGYDAALMAQLAASILVAGAVGVVWYRCASFDLKAAVLLFGTLLATPYAWPYEMVIPFAGVAYALRAGLGRRPVEAVAFVWIWITPTLSLNNGPLPVQLLTVAIAGCFAMAVAAGLGADRQAASHGTAG